MIINHPPEKYRSDWIIRSQLLGKIKAMFQSPPTRCFSILLPMFVASPSTTPPTRSSPNKSSQWPMVLSLGICPSGWMPCSKQKSSQHLGSSAASHIAGMGAAHKGGSEGNFSRNFTGNSRNSWDFYGMFNGFVWILMGCELVLVEIYRISWDLIGFNAV